jgi:DNA polymerase epsilon subunit 2
LVTLKSTKQLLGRPGHRFLLLGMLTHNKEGKMCLEDADGGVVLDYSTLVCISFVTITLDGIFSVGL